MNKDYARLSTKDMTRFGAVVLTLAELALGSSPLSAREVGNQSEACSQSESILCYEESARVEERPRGVINGQNYTFTLSRFPARLPVMMYRNGLRCPTSEYKVTGPLIVMSRAPSAGDDIRAVYAASPRKTTGLSNTNTVAFGGARSSPPQGTTDDVAAAAVRAALIEEERMARIEPPRRTSELNLGEQHASRADQSVSRGLQMLLKERLPNSIRQAEAKRAKTGDRSTLQGVDGLGDEADFSRTDQYASDSSMPTPKTQEVRAIKMLNTTIERNSSRERVPPAIKNGEKQ